MALLLAAGVPWARAVEESPVGFTAPNMYAARFVGLVRRDLADRIPGKETLFKQYVDELDFQFETMSIFGHVFGYNIDLDGRFPYDLTLLDRDCDGIFETKVDHRVDRDVEMTIPECVFALDPRLRSSAR
ncbi:MAG: hypothetical protein ACE5JJ_02075 [Nitrospinota bacterium]